MDLLLGLDVGTTATKACVYDLEGRVVAAASANYESGLRTPQEGWIEQDPEELWRAVVQATRAAAAASAGQGRIVALALSAQGGTTITADADGQALRPAISWMDTRAALAEGPELGRLWGGEFFYRTTGWWSEAALPLQHICWLRRHEPHIFAAAARFLFVNDYVLARMTGEYCMDPTDAAITMLHSLEQGGWDERLLDIAGIARSQLSPIRPSATPVGPLRPAVAAELGLAGDVMAVNGAHDQYCAALGAGVIAPGDALLSCGTAWVLLFSADRPVLDERQVFHPAPHVVPGQWGALSSLPSAGAAAEWYVQQVLPGPEAAGHPHPERYKWFNDGAARVPAGSNHLLFIPLLSGPYPAVQGAQARGAWLGLTLAHTKDEMSRSVMEGVAFEVRRLAELAEGLGVRLGFLKMVGGAAASPVWPQVVADVLGLPVILPGVKEAASRGAAILAGVGAGLFRDVEEGLARFGGGETRLEPDPRTGQKYRDLYTVYQDAFWKLQSIFANLMTAQP
jgi:xylulokinase